MATELKAKNLNEVAVTQYDVSVIPNDFNIVTINNLIESGSIEMPVFQRNYIWDKNRASKFIESLILGLPIPQIFFYQKERNKFLVIDGQQRLLTIYYFIKQRFPRNEKRAELRKIFDNNGYIPDFILSDDEYFQDFKLKFGKLENGTKHLLDGLKYNTLGAYKANFEFMTIRCMTVRQNEPKEDDSSIFEIFNRLNTGGVNLTNQEIRACLYYSDFYKMLYKLNQNDIWRRIWGKPEDGKSKDIEVILRSLALLCNYEKYNGAMNAFISRFAKQATNFKETYTDYLQQFFVSYLNICDRLPRSAFLTQNKKFNAALFDSIFVAVGSAPFAMQKLITEAIDCRQIEKLKDDKDFEDAITHSTSHTSAVKTRVEKAKEYLL